MKRNRLIMSALMNKLCQLIDRQADLFIRERLWLTNHDLPAQIHELPEERSYLEIQKTAVLEQLAKLIDLQPPINEHYSDGEHLFTSYEN